jgi:hypothetical protein
MSPRLDAVEEVTVTFAAQGADANGQGATQIKFATRSGSNKFSGSGYFFYQSDKLNTNTYSNKIRNLAKGKTTLYQPGFRVGGPVLIPGVFDGHDKLFFFVNYEESRSPSTTNTTSTLLLPAAQQGLFSYTTATGVQTVDLYALAAAAGLTATPDPVIAKLLNDIRASTTTVPGTFIPINGNLRAEQFAFQQPTRGTTTYPTIRFDYNLTSKHKITGSYNRNYLISAPDTTNGTQATWPGFPIHGEQDSLRYTWSGTLRSTLGRNLVNEVHIGGSGGPTFFSTVLEPGMWNGSLANQNGYAITLGAGVTSAGVGGGVSSREGFSRLMEDTVTFIKGSHSMSAGVSYTRYGVWLQSGTRVPTVTLGVPTGDPSANLFSATNFPGSNATDRSNAQALYALLVGDVSSITGTARLDGDTGKYVYNGDSLQRGRLQQVDTFFQDNWRVRPTLSLNVGLRYAVQPPFYSLNGSYSTASLDDIWGISGNLASCDPSAPTPATCNLFKQGVTPGTKPDFENLTKGTKAYNTDWNNWAPSIGANWTPVGRGPVLGKILGKPGESSISAGWVRSYERHGMSDFTGVFGSNPGLTQNATRNTANGNLGNVPLLFRNGNLGGPPLCSVSNTTGCMPDAPVYPLVPTVTTGSINIFDPNLQVPYSDTYTTGFQRQLGRKSAMEIRYLGSRNRQQWTTYNMNEINIIDNHFLDEFKLAQANLQANLVAGRGGTFAYFGAGTGTSPLPIYLAYFSGITAANAGNSALYTSTQFTNANFVNSLVLYGSNPFTPAGNSSTTGLSGDPQRRANALAAGLPANFFLANPDATGGANVTGYGGYTSYNSLQLQFRRRLSGGLQADASYTFGKGFASNRVSFRVPRYMARDSGSEGDVTHALKFTFLYDLPFGQGRRFGGNVGSGLDRLIGGWTISGTGWLQSGRLVDIGGVRVVGMTLDDVRKAFKLRRTEDKLVVYSWPQDIIDNTIKAYSVSATQVGGYTLGAPSGRYFAPANGPDCIESIANGYGDCGEPRSFVLTGPMIKSTDISIRKRMKIQGHVMGQIDIDIFNVFDFINFTQTSGIGSSTTSGYQVGLPGAARTAQLGFRVTW